jgi:hypothetical protein
MGMVGGPLLYWAEVVAKPSPKAWRGSATPIEFLLFLFRKKITFSFSFSFYIELYGTHVLLLLKLM